jgi:hypothetical protein
MPKVDQTDKLAGALRDLLALHDGQTATRAAIRVALGVAVREFGPAFTVNALRDLADEMERDLIAVTWQ